MSDKNIMLENISSATVVICAPDTTFRREMAPGRKIGITEDDYNELSFMPGFQVLVNGGFIRITGKTAEAESLVEESFTISDKKSLSPIEVKALFESGDVEEFKAILENASLETKELIVRVAVDNRFVDNAYTSLIEQYCDVDVLKAISYANDSAK